MTTQAIVIPQDTKFAANVKKNILPNINLPAGFINQCICSSARCKTHGCCKK